MGEKKKKRKKRQKQKAKSIAYQVALLVFSYSTYLQESKGDLRPQAQLV